MTNILTQPPIQDRLAYLATRQQAIQDALLAETIARPVAAVALYLDAAITRAFLACERGYAQQEASR